MLARDFDSLALPRHGRYPYEPARADEEGVIWVPPKPQDILPSLLAVGGLAALTFLAVRQSRKAAQ